MGLKVATKSTDVAPDEQAGVQSLDPAIPVERHHSRHICSKQTEVKVATKTTKNVPDSKMNGKSTDIQTQPVSRTRQQTNAIKSAQATTPTGMIIHPSGMPCRKQNTVSQTASTSNTKTNVTKVTEAAKGLLLLNMDENTDDLEQELNKNAELMPVGAPPKPDLVKEIEQEKWKHMMTMTPNSMVQTLKLNRMQIQTNPPREKLCHKEIWL